MRTYVGLLVAAAVLLNTAPALAASDVDKNKLANFITIKEYMHCAQYNVALINHRAPPPGARANRVEQAGGFIAAALKIDGAMTAQGVAPAKQYIATLPLAELQRRYKTICNQIDKHRRINNRLYDWRYRLNAQLPVPAGFYKMSFEGAMPPDWYLPK